MYNLVKELNKTIKNFELRRKNKMDDIICCIDDIKLFESETLPELKALVSKYKPLCKGCLLMEQLHKLNGGKYDIILKDGIRKTKLK